MKPEASIVSYEVLKELNKIDNKKSNKYIMAWHVSSRRCSTVPTVV